jgi:hypothetical protein
MSGFITSTSIVTDVALTVPNLTGGTNGRVVRLNGVNSVVDAANTDTTSQLNTVMVKINNQYFSQGYITGFTGLTAGAPYFLGTSGNITAVPPTPSSSVRAMYIGFALNSTDIIFRPGIPVGGA